MDSSDLDREDVLAVYDALQESHEQTWRRHGHRSLHYGYYDADHDDPGAAIEHTIRVLAAAAGVGPGDRVLDLGCGAGGAAVWLAGERGATVVGVDVNDTLLELTAEHARRSDVADRVSVRSDDFHELATVEDGSFDVVWALEAFSHTDDAERVLRQARRALDDGGRVVIAGMFRRPRELSEGERERLRSVHETLGARCGAIDDLETVLAEHGFEAVEIRDVTGAVLPSARRRGLTGLVSYPFYRLLQLVGRTNETRVDTLLGAYHSYRLVRSGGLGYYVVTAET